jgi:hypothetical protein
MNKRRVIGMLVGLLTALAAPTFASAQGRPSPAAARAPTARFGARAFESLVAAREQGAGALGASRRADAATRAMGGTTSYTNGSVSHDAARAHSTASSANRFAANRYRTAAAALRSASRRATARNPRAAETLALAADHAENAANAHAALSETHSHIQILHQSAGTSVNLYNMNDYARGLTTEAVTLNTPVTHQVDAVTTHAEGASTHAAIAQEHLIRNW